MRDAAAVFSRALVLIALRYCAGKTREVERLTGGAACGIEFRLIQGGPATRLTSANNHQTQYGQENRDAEVLLHEESSEGSNCLNARLKTGGR